jgi:hypothetical protein
MIRPLKPSDIDERFADTDRKQLGVPLVVWRDGQVVEIPPEEIVVDPPEDRV